jgi:superfamily I DNA/RNA helicase
VPLPLDAAAEAAALAFLSGKDLRPSAEQAAVVHALLEGRHATVNAVAGSGKTTTVLFLAANLLVERRGRRILLLTYNKDLKEETRIRVEKLGLRDQVEAHSFHAAGYKYYSDECAKDHGLRHCVLSERPAWRTKPAPYDFVVIDEAQDVDRLKFAFTARLVQKSLLDAAGAAAKQPQFLVIGDERQAIYDYLGADARFLRFADRGVWSAPEDARPWARLKLTMSFRITPPMASFVSEIMLHSPDYIVSSRPRGAARALERVEYWVGSAFASARRVAREIIDLVNGGFDPGEIFILAKSVKQAALKAVAEQDSQTPMQVINQLLSEARIPCRVTLNDPDAGSKQDNKGHVLFSTMNQAKGRERRLVYVVGFSNDSFTYFARDAPPLLCPNLL